MIYALWIVGGIIALILAVFGDHMIEPVDEINDEDFGV